MKELQELKEAHAKLAEAIATMEAKQKDETWPKVWGKYWRISSVGSVNSVIWSGDTSDKGMLSIGNVFRTESDAQKEIETRKTIAEFRAQPGRKKFVVDADNWCAVVNFRTGKVEAEIMTYSACALLNASFDSKKSAQAAINAVGADRLLAASKWLSMGE